MSTAACLCHNMPSLISKPQAPYLIRLPASTFSRPTARSRRPFEVRYTATELTVDVAVVGSGVIGLCVAENILRRTGGSASVALVGKKEVGAATGAGQGYIWLAHRALGTPLPPAWQLASWSKELWEDLLDPESKAAMEWEEKGSLLLAKGAEEQQQLADRHGMLQQANISADLFDSHALQELEPALAVSPDMRGLLVTSDAQMSGRAAARVLLGRCASFDSFQYLEDEGAQSMQVQKGRVLGLHTEAGRRIVARKGCVIACGAWTGRFLASALGENTWLDAFQPRKGHLLELADPPSSCRLHYGLMELAYSKHYAGGSKSAADGIAVTFTATMSAQGTLLLGSSREFAGFDASLSQDVEDAILAHASKFIPGLAQISPQQSTTRVGLRPYAKRPIIGTVPGVDGLFVAGGHEGSGLTLGPATAEITGRQLFQAAEPVPDFAEYFSPAAFLSCT